MLKDLFGGLYFFSTDHNFLSLVLIRGGGDILIYVIKYELNTQNNKFKTYNQKQKSNLYSKGFTIVELLVVIVVIGILAAITIVSYTGVSQKAIASSLQSDLTNSSNKLKMYQVEHGSYPETMTSTDGNITYCPSGSTPADTKYCIEPSSGNTFTYSRPSPSTFSLTATHTASTTEYVIADNTAPEPVVSLAVSDPANWLAVGNQVWAKYNLNIGTRIAGDTSQTNNSLVEKYCYEDNESNCTTYGALYQWNEAMQYTTTEGAQGICPAGSHIPSNNEWTTLTTFLGIASAGTQLKPGGTSGLNIPLGGQRYSDDEIWFIDEYFVDLSSFSYLWSSSESSTNAWDRSMYSGNAVVANSIVDKSYGFSVRCMGN